MRASSLALLVGAGLSQAQLLISELSFGYAGRMSKGGVIPNFALSGAPQEPEVLSNKIILTPPAPGNQRSSVWADQKLTHDSWIADLDFRATGPERGGGNLNIWLTDGGPRDVASNSAYTVGRFDGLVLVVDDHGGSGGMIRGFLNDGSTDFASQNDISSLAFGHCQYSYRNLGRPSQIKMRQTAAGRFAVEIDSRPCFETDKVRVPAGYQFGVTAASADNPDSFEVFKFVVMAENAAAGGGGGSPQQQQKQQQQEQKQQKQGGFFGRGLKADADPESDSDPFDTADQSPDVYASSAEQFADLHNRLQSMTHHVSNVYRTVSKHARSSDQQKSEIKGLVDMIRNDVIPRLDRVASLEGQVASLEKELKAMRRDVNTQVKNSERAMQRALGEHHKTLTSSFTENVPGHGKLIAVIIGSQIVAAVGYYLYKRRRANMPKKFL